MKTERLEVFAHTDITQGFIPIGVNILPKRNDLNTKSEVNFVSMFPISISK